MIKHFFWKTGLSKYLFYLTLLVAMSNRYDINTKFLNLSKFEADTSLVEAGLFLPLSRVNVANFVVTVIIDYIPELEGLDFSNNLMYNISCLAPLAVKCKELKTLKLAGNKVCQLNWTIVFSNRYLKVVIRASRWPFSDAWFNNLSCTVLISD